MLKETAGAAKCCPTCKESLIETDNGIATIQAKPDAIPPTPEEAWAKRGKPWTVVSCRRQVIDNEMYDCSCGTRHGRNEFCAIWYGGIEPKFCECGDSRCEGDCSPES